MNSSYNVVGVLAHVDAGKTTLSEAILYNSGVIRTLGRVDKRDTFLDTNHIERERGITIFSKQARIKVNDKNIILLDTPGHMDFSAETERTLPLLDAAILVVSGIDGVQVHTKTLFKLLRRYHIPVSIFVNKDLNKFRLKIIKQSDDLPFFRYLLAGNSIRFSNFGE